MDYLLLAIACFWVSYKVVSFFWKKEQEIAAQNQKSNDEFHAVNLNGAVYKAKFELLHEYIVQEKIEKQAAYELTYRLISMGIDRANQQVPYYPQIQQTAQNTPYTGVSTQQQDKNVDRGGGTDTIDLVLRGGVKEGEISLSAAGFNHNGYILPIPPKHAPVTEFGNTGVYLGSCLQCGTHFATKHSETKFCGENNDRCKNEYHNLRR